MIKEAQALLDLLLTRKGDFTGGQPVDKLEHSLQTAYLAAQEYAGEGWGDEMIVAALFHDAAGAISPSNHGAVIAEIMKPWLSYDLIEVLRHHEDFQILNSHNVNIRGRYAHHLWYSCAVEFVDQYDWPAFSPNLVGKAKIDDFLPYVERVIK